MGNADFMQSQIEEKLEKGFDCIKLKIGVNWNSEKEIIKKLREKFPKELLELRVDANGAFNYDEAKIVLQELAELGIHSIEQPIKKSEVQSPKSEDSLMAKLCAETPTPVSYTHLDVYKRQIYRRVTEPGTPVQLKDFLQKGINQVAAGYVVYGSSTMIVYTTGNGVNGFTLDPSIGTYYLSHPNMKFSATGKIYSINEGNYIKFPQGVKDYIKYCQLEEGDRPYTSRYIGSSVSYTHLDVYKRQKIHFLLLQY